MVNRDILVLHALRRQRGREVVPQRIEVALTLAYPRAELGTLLLRLEVDGEVVGVGAVDKVGERAGGGGGYDDARTA